MSSDFSSRVNRLVSKIPSGRVATYQQIAQLAGSPKAARAVGMLMKHNPDLKNIPCHRVIGSDGHMHGYAGQDGIPGKIRRLKSEGVVFQGQTVDLAQFRWHSKNS
jgi:O-6-methylguanine DNA methyltransferase